MFTEYTPTEAREKFAKYICRRLGIKEKNIKWEKFNLQPLENGCWDADYLGELYLLESEWSYQGSL